MKKLLFITVITLLPLINIAQNSNNDIAFTNTVDILPDFQNNYVETPTYVEYQENDETIRMREKAERTSLNVPSNATITPYYIEITNDATTSLVFPSKVVAIDRGTNTIVSKKVDGVENVLKIKAGNPFTKPSNLTVITEDGKIYAFSVAYQLMSNYHVIDMRKVNMENSYGAKKVGSNVTTRQVKFESTGMNSKEIKDISNSILMQRSTEIKSDKEFNIRLSIKKVFVKNDIIFIPIQILNQGDLNYDIDLVKFLIKDKKNKKRTAQQVLELDPVFVFNEKETVEKGRANTQVFAFSKFTINKNKKLDIVVYEENGGRNVKCTLNFKDISNAEYVH